MRLIGVLIAAAMAIAATAQAATLDNIKAKNFLQCGVSDGLAGFAFIDAEGNWDGFDVSFCRATAAAIFGDPGAIKFTPTTGKTRFTALASGEVDILYRNTTWTLSRDVDLKFSFLGVNYYDGQGFLVRRDMGLTSARELGGATVCNSDRHHHRAQPGGLFPHQQYELRAGSDRDQHGDAAEVSVQRL